MYSYCTMNAIGPNPASNIVGGRDIKSTIAENGIKGRAPAVNIPTNQTTKGNQNLETRATPYVPTAAYLSVISDIRLPAFYDELESKIVNLANIFTSKKENLLKVDNPENRDTLLTDYYQAFRDSLPIDCRANLDTMIEGFHDRSIAETTGQEKMIALRQRGSFPIANGTLESLQKSFIEDSISDDLKKRLVNDLKTIFGTYAQRTSCPKALLDNLKQQVLEALGESINDLNDTRFSVLANGTFGVVAKFQDSKFTAVIKLPISPEDREFIDDFKQESAAIKSYRELSDYPLIELPDFIYGSRGQAIEEPSKYMLKKFQSGQNLAKSDLTDYVTKGFSDEFLTQYLKFYIEASKKEISLDDLRHYNYYYKPETQNLSFFEVGVNSDLPDVQERRKINYEHPLGAAIYSMLGHVCTFEAKRGEPIQLKERIAAATANKVEEDFYAARVEQITRILGDFITNDSNGYSAQDLSRELDFLKTNKSTYFQLTEKGHQYLDTIRNAFNSQDQ